MRWFYSQPRNDTKYRAHVKLKVIRYRNQWPFELLKEQRSDLWSRNSYGELLLKIAVLHVCDQILWSKSLKVLCGGVHLLSEESIVICDDDICLSFVRMIRPHFENPTRREVLYIAKLINSLKGNQTLQPFLDTWMRNYWNDKIWVCLIEIKFLAGRIWSIINDWE